MLPLHDALDSVLDNGLLFFCEIFLTWFSFPPYTVHDHTANCALYWRPATSSIQIQRLSHGVMWAHDGKSTETTEMNLFF